MGPTDPDSPSLLRRVAEAPQLLLLRIVSAGVIGSLTIAAGAVWLAAKLDRRRK